MKRGIRLSFYWVGLVVLSIPGSGCTDEPNCEDCSCYESVV